ncbi:MAG: hypothetical protein B7Y42_09275, partial [Polaromonas sp. 28-63-22]
MATIKPANFTVNLADLLKILQQIKIAEQHVATGVLSNLDGTPLSPLLPAGLRTVDGSYNNLLPGKSLVGSADQVMPRLLTTNFLNDRDGDQMPLGPPGSGAPTITNTNYDLLGRSGSVADADPRIISNLISDQTVGNFAAVYKALELAGSPDAWGDTMAILAAFTAAEAAVAAMAEWEEAAALVAGDLLLAQENDAAAQAALAAALAGGDPAEIEQAQQLATLASEALVAATSSNEEAQTTLLFYRNAAVQAATDAAQLPVDLGLEISPNGSITILNQSPDIGLSPPFNGWMTMFGQFFDHGLDLIPKAGNGTVYIPLQPDDPLYVPGGPNFMALTRSATVTLPGVDGVLGTADDVLTHETTNLTTPFIDQNQTYTSNASHQVFLREYKMVEGKPANTGHLLDGANGGIANWGEVKQQAREKLGIELNDYDVLNVPLLRTDAYGKFIPGANGFAQLITGVGPDGVANTADDLVLEGSPTAPVGTATALRTNHAFLDDIAHNAAPGFWDHDGDPTTAKVAKTADLDDTISTADQPQAAGTYDNELLDRHFITGDGRGNENIGLTTVHTIFHAEHNRLVEANKLTILASADLAIINEWLATDLTDLSQIPTDAPGIAALNWDGERLFQAARFVTEMEYQHLVFEEFARKVQPAINPFVFSASPDLDPSIVAEFAHVVYRFGHSMLTETVDRLTSTNQVVDADPNAPGAQQIGLISAFLNPVEFDQNGTISAAVASGQIIRGMTRQVGNEIDEFVTEALRNNLVGLPLDLGALNIARGRDTGVPSLNEARAQFYDMTADSRLTPYTSWLDFATHMKNPLSVVNFIAAYGTHQSILDATTNEARRDAAMLLVFGGDGAPIDSVDYLNSTGAWATMESGLNAVDFWIGGLAEEKQEFGGMLGSTFNFVFETQMELLQNGDRFYYLSRTQGMNLLNQLEANSFANLVMRNTDLGEVGQGHLPGDLFDTPDFIIEVVRAVQIGNDPTGFVRALVPLTIRRDTDRDGDTDFLQFNGGQHVVLGGSEEADTLIGGLGIDTLWGDGGNDRLDGGYEADKVHGGDGDDIITNLGGDDFLFGEEGNDVISMGLGIVLGFGGRGNDFIMTGNDPQEIFAGEGNDFLLGGSGADFLLGNEGDDWVEGGEGFDGLAGDNSELFFNSPIIGHDVLNGQGNDTDYDGESGDDIMFQTAGITRSNGMFGFDWGIHKGDNEAANSDLGIPLFAAQAVFTLRDRFDSVEGLSGWDYNDVLTGAAVLRGFAGPGNPADESDLKAGNVSLINGLAELLGLTPADVALMAANTSVIDATLGAEVIIGGGGSDTIRGNLGNDILDGDAWLNVRISVRSLTDHTVELFSVDSLNEVRSRLLSGELNPGQLQIVREILQSTTAATDVDTAVYGGLRSEYTITSNIDGTRNVTHTNPANAGVLDDGSDMIRNFERLQFSDGFLQLDTVSINGTVTEDQTLTVDTAGISALGALSIQWLRNGVAIAGATGATLLLGDADVGTRITVSVSYTSAEGPAFALSLPTVPVVNVNDAPVITATAAVTIDEDGVASGVAAGSDVDNALLSYAAGAATSGAVTIDAATGAWSYTPALNFNGSDSFTVTVSDGLLSAQQVVSVTVNPVNDAPTGAASAVLAAGAEDTAYTVTLASLLAGFSDVDIATNGQALGVANLLADNGSVIGNLDGSYTITPNLNFNGTMALTYDVVDGNGGTVA